jgi:hypothetical protein
VSLLREVQHERAPKSGSFGLIFVGKIEMLRTFRQLLKVLAYGYAAYLCLYPLTESSNKINILIDPSYWSLVIVTFISAWVVALITNWIFADRES